LARILLAEVQAAVVREETQLAAARDRHRTGDHPDTRAQHFASRFLQRHSILEARGHDRRDDFRIDLKLSRPRGLFPGLVFIDDDAVVENTNSLAHDGLVVLQTIRDQPAVAHHEIAGLRLDLAEQPRYPVIGAIHTTGTGVEHDQAARVLAALLCMRGKVT
jgi:hypothetical protein